MSRNDIQTETAETISLQDKNDSPRATEEALQLLNEKPMYNRTSELPSLPGLQLIDSEANPKATDSAQPKDAAEGRQAAQLMDAQGPNAPGASSVTQEARDILNRNANAQERAQTQSAFNAESRYYVAVEANGVNGKILAIRADNNNDGRAD